MDAVTSAPSKFTVQVDEVTVVNLVDTVGFGQGSLSQKESDGSTLHQLVQGIALVEHVHCFLIVIGQRFGQHEFRVCELIMRTLGRQAIERVRFVKTSKDFVCSVTECMLH